MITHAETLELLGIALTSALLENLMSGNPVLARELLSLIHYADMTSLSYKQHKKQGITNERNVVTRTFTQNLIIFHTVKITFLFLPRFNSSCLMNPLVASNANMIKTFF